MDDPQFIKSADGEDLVVLTRKDYDTLIEALAEAEEELADIAIADQCLADLAQGKAEPLPAEVSRLILSGHRRLRAIRIWRSLSVAELASKSGVAEAVINAHEVDGTSPASAHATNLAAALDVSVAWIE